MIKWQLSLAVGWIALCASVHSVSAQPVGGVAIGHRPMLSGDGRTLAYRCFPVEPSQPAIPSGGEGALCALDLVTGLREVLVEEPTGFAIEQIAVSFNGKKVVYDWPGTSASFRRQLYVFDLNSGTSELITVAPDGVSEANGTSSRPDMTPDGQFVSFYSEAANLVSGFNSEFEGQIFVRDLQAGTTEMVSISSSGEQSTGGTGRALEASGISDNGNLVVFGSGAENLIADDTEGNFDIFLRDRAGGTTIRVTEFEGAGADRDSFSPQISGDGRWVSFRSRARNLGIVKTTTVDEAYIKEIGRGQFRRAAASLTGGDPNDRSPATSDAVAKLGQTGRFLLYSSWASDLVGDDVTASSPDLFVTDQNAGTLLINRDAEGTQFEVRDQYAMSEGGRFVAWAAGGAIFVTDRGDVRGPDIFDIVIPSGVPLDDFLEIRARAREVISGSLLASAEFRVDGGPWAQMNADDGAFDSQLEDISQTVTTNSLGTGPHEICLRAFDTVGNAALPVCVEITVAPPLSGLEIICTHSPIWPQLGDTVTITAEPVVSSLGTDPTALVSDTVQIWTGDPSTPVEEGNVVDVLSHSFEAQVEGTFQYACGASTEGAVAFGGWRLGTIGEPMMVASEGPIPVLYTGPSNERLDFVFVPDRDSYSGPLDPAFLADVFTQIRDGYYGYHLFLVNQNGFNFWISAGTGFADDSANGCNHETPPFWNPFYSFADVGAILHTKDQRDCAPGGRNLFSSEVSQGVNVLRHETGHRPFGLSDEYCCDGGYFQEKQAPNMFETLEACMEDAVSLLRDPSSCYNLTTQCMSDPAGCDPVVELPDLEEEFFQSEPIVSDLMKNNTQPGAADVRRILWVFRRCAEGKC